MITAQEAKKIYDHSGVEVIHFMESIVEKKVKESAISGKCSVFIHLGCEHVHNRPEYEPVHNSAMLKLKELGYTVEKSSDGVEYVPKGLADNDGHGPLHRNFGFTVSW